MLIFLADCILLFFHLKNFNSIFFIPHHVFFFNKIIRTSCKMFKIGEVFSKTGIIFMTLGKLGYLTTLTKLL